MPDNNIPMLVRETSNGLTVHSILDEMFRRREVEYVGEVNAESAYGVCRQLMQLAHEDPDKEITMYINSPGGEVVSGLALVDVMEAIPCPIRTVCMGMAYSMGSIIFAAGNQRDIMPHGEVMIHDPRLYNVGGPTAAIEETSRRMVKTRETINGLLARYTGKSIKEINRKTLKDSYFDAQEAVEFGLADRVTDKF